MPEQELNQTTPTINIGESADDFLERALRENPTALETPPGQETLTEEPADEAGIQEVTTETEEKPAGEEPEKPEEAKEAELLKQHKLSEKSIGELAKNYNAAKNRATILNWAVNNVDGFGDWLTEQYENRNQPGEKSINGFAKPAEPVKPEDDILKEYDQESVEIFKKISKALGFVHRDDLQAERQAETMAEAKKSAKSNIDAFQRARTKELTEMGLDWENEVFPAIDKIISEDFGIDNLAKITPQLLARAYNTYLIETPGGMERIIANAKNQAIQEQANKEKLPKPITRSTGTGAGKSRDIVEWAKGKDVSADDIEKAMREEQAKLRR